MAKVRASARAGILTQACLIPCLSFYTLTSPACHNHVCVCTRTHTHVKHTHTQSFRAWECCKPTTPAKVMATIFQHSFWPQWVGGPSLSPSSSWYKMKVIFTYLPESATVQCYVSPLFHISSFSFTTLELYILRNPSFFIF